jgi:methionyl-tRNA synthetase
VINEDKQAAATTVYTALQAINYLKVLLSPFLPFTAQQLHEMLGFEGQLFGEQRIESYHEETHTHEALVYDGAKATGRWEALSLPPGQQLREPVALFKKLDESVIEEEIAHLGA